MRGIHPFPQQGPEIRENWRMVNQILDEVYFRRWLTAENGEPIVPAVKAFVGAAGAVVPGFVLVDAAVSQYVWLVPLDPSVGPSVARITFWYSSSVGGVANFNLSWIVNSFDTAGTIATVGTVAAGYAGPAVANTWVQGGPIVLSTNPFIAGRHLALRVVLVRDGLPDANNNPFNFIQALLEVLPL